ncbi:hypothetical protein D3C76_1572740 [compost metagenome]
MKLAATGRNRLGRLLAHQTEQPQAIDLALAERGIPPVRHIFHHLGHDASQRGGQGGALQGIQTAGDHEMRILRCIRGLSLSTNEKGPVKGPCLAPSAFHADREEYESSR